LDSSVDPLLLDESSYRLRNEIAERPAGCGTLADS
jgi:hypothetical protein